MSKFILGKKVEMTQKFQEDGTVVPVTVVQAGPCVITQVKAGDKNGYTALQIGFGQKRVLNKPITGHLKGLDNFRYLREFRVDKVDNFQRGQIFDVSSFQAGDILSVTAISKGKGFQGVVKRHGFHGSPASHGHKDQLRMPGSIGATDAARVFKGTRMGGHMGDATITTKNLELIEVDTEKNLLYIKGSVPGARKALVTVVADGELTFKSVASPKSKVKSPESEVENKDEKFKDNKKLEDNKSSFAKATDDGGRQKSRR